MPTVPTADYSYRTAPVQHLYPSNAFYLAAGTITIDLPRRKLLVIRDRRENIQNFIKLPRGRKDWDESLPTTAERETYEETGVRARLLPVPLTTRATRPALSDVPATVVDADEVTSGVPLCEPVAVMFEHAAFGGALAIVFWYVAEADSTAELDTGTQMADEDYEARWVDFDEAAGLMSLPDYAEVVKNALEVVGRMTSGEGRFVNSD